MLQKNENSVFPRPIAAGVGAGRQPEHTGGCWCFPGSAFEFGTLPFPSQEGSASCAGQLVRSAGQGQEPKPQSASSRRILAFPMEPVTPSIPQRQMLETLDWNVSTAICGRQRPFPLVPTGRERGLERRQSDGQTQI